MKKKIVASLCIDNMSDKNIEYESKKIRSECGNPEYYDLVILYSSNNGIGSESLYRLYTAQNQNENNIWHVQIPTAGLNSVDSMNKIQKRKSEIKSQMSSNDKLIVTSTTNTNLYLYAV